MGWEFLEESSQKNLLTRLLILQKSYSNRK